MGTNAVYAASDRKYGDFLIEHWLRSLRASSSGTPLEVRILDYGLSTAQRYYLDHEGVRRIPCVRDGHPAVVRFRDMAADLERCPADQVLACDGGDILFQADLGPLFESQSGAIRAVAESIPSGFDAFLTDTFFTKADQRRLRSLLPGKPQINAGLLVGPGAAMARLGREVHRMVLRHDRFGPDQVAVNALLHSQGWTELDMGWNYVVATAGRPFVVEDGRFLFADTRQPIPVVHNAGNWSILRPIRNFGWGPGCNQLKPEVLRTLRAVHHSTGLLLGTRDQWNHITNRAWKSVMALRPRDRAS